MAQREKELRRIGLTNPWLKAGYPPALEAALRETWPGMGNICDVTSLHNCGECRDWQPAKGPDRGYCLLHLRSMHGKRGDVLKASQKACRSWSSNLAGAPEANQDEPSFRFAARSAASVK
jgi:hypothetical protein